MKDEEEDYCDPLKDGCGDYGQCASSCSFRVRFSQCPNLERECDKRRMDSIEYSIKSYKIDKQKCEQTGACLPGEIENIEGTLEELKKEKIELEREFRNKWKKDGKK